jgi:uncharacterized protein
VKTKRYLDLGTKIETRDAEGGKRIISGLIPYNFRSEDLGGFVEVIEPSAFRKTLNDGAEVFAFWAHDSAEVLGSTRAGTLRLEDRADGLAFEVEVRDTAIGEDRFEAIRRGDVAGVSFGFYTERDEWDHTQKPSLRKLKEVRLLEVSPGVAFPAYTGAQSGASLRSIVEEIRSNPDRAVSEPVTSPDPDPAPPATEPAPEDRSRAEFEEAKRAAILQASLAGIQL